MELEGGLRGLSHEFKGREGSEGDDVGFWFGNLERLKLILQRKLLFSRSK